MIMEPFLALLLTVSDHDDGTLSRASPHHARTTSRSQARSIRHHCCCVAQSFKMLVFVVISICSLCLIAAGCIYGYIRWLNSPLWSLPGPPRRSFLFGQFFTIMNEPFLKPHREWLAQAPPNAPMLHYTQLMGKHTLFVMDADIAKEIYLAPSHAPSPRFIKRSAILPRVMGKGLVILEGPDWQRHRRILHPAFNDRFLRQQLNRSVPRKVQDLIRYWKSARGREIDVQAHTSILTLDVIGDVAFSHDFRGMESISCWAEEASDDRLPEVSDQLVASMREVFRLSAYRVLLYLLRMPFLDFAGRRSDVAINAAADQIVQRAREIVRARNADPEAKLGPSPSKYEPKSILELLVDAKTREDEKRRLTDVELRDEVKTFIVAGHETTSTWIYWALFALCQYPDVQEKVHEDVMEQSESLEGETMSLEVVEKMTYLDAFLKETLRFYPPVGTMIKHNTQPEVLGGVTVPTDSLLVIPVQLLHRSPLYWDQPESFLPERWLSADASPPYKHPMAFIPFSAGPRTCIGYKFATMEAKLILAPLIRAFRFQLASSLRDTKFELRVSLTLKAKPDFKALAVPR